MLLTAGERVLLHLFGFWNAKDPPEAITQQGIADAARLRRSHVPRTVKALAREGHVEEREGRVQGRGRKVKVYFLTEAGLRRARQLASTLGTQVVVADAGPTTLAEFAKASGRTILEISVDVDEGGRYRGGARDVGSPEFVGRRDELAALAEWLRSEAGVMVVYGGTGMGKTTLARRFLHRSLRTFWWRELGANDEAFLADLAEFLMARQRGNLVEWLAGEGDLEASLERDLEGQEVLLVLDDYGDLPEQVVETMGHLVRGVTRAQGAKLLVLAQETTPSYCRFYDRRAVEEGRVREIHLRGLTIEESRMLLGKSEIADEALRRIYLLTKGCPLYIELIREGDAKTLKARSRFTTAEVNLLMFSRDVVS